MPRKDTSIFGTLPPETRDAIFRLGESKTLEEALAIVNAPEAEEGYGIKIKKSAFAEWLDKERTTRKTESFILKLQRGSELLDEAEGAIKTANGANYEQGILAAVREYTLDLLATGKAEAKDIFLLCTTLGGNAKAKLEQEKLLLERRKVAVAETKVAQEVLAKAREIQLISKDRTLDDQARVARVQTLLFGEKPADVPTLAEKGKVSPR